MQKIVGSILYYARAVDMAVLMTLSLIASEQMKGTERTLEKAVWCMRGWLKKLVNVTFYEFLRCPFSKIFKVIII